MNDNTAGTPSETPNQENSLPPVADFDQEPATQAQAPGETVMPVANPEPIQPNFNPEPIQPTAPISAPTPQAEPTAASSPAKPKSKKPLILAILTVIILALIGSGAAAYVFWYQNPDRIVGEAMMKLVATDNIKTNTVITSDSEIGAGFINIKVKRIHATAEASTESGTGQGDVTVTMELNGRDYEIGAKGLFAGDQTVYFQIVNIKELVTKLATDLGGVDQVPADVQKGLEELQNRWVKVPLTDLTEDEETVVCMIETTMRIAGDDRYAEEARQLYMKHKFIAVGDSVGEKDGNLGYKVKLDDKAYKDYVKASASSDAAAEFKKCPGYEESDFNPDNNNQIDEIDSRTSIDVVVWVSRFGHELKQLDFTLTAKNPQTKDVVFTGQTKFAYDKVDVKAPAESVDLETWQNDFQKTVESTTEEIIGSEVAPTNQEFTLPVESTT